MSIEDEIDMLAEQVEDVARREGLAELEVLDRLKNELNLPEIAERA